MNKELGYLKNKLQGPIIKIINPADHSTDAIMKSYFREILVIARKYVRPMVDFEDLVVEGILGLLDAIRRYDTTKAKGNPRAFHNLAIVRIKSNMFEYFLSNNSLYSIPNYMSRAMTLVDQIRNLVLSVEHDSDPQETILRYHNVSFEEVIPKAKSKKLSRLKEKVVSLALNSGKTYEEMIINVLRVESEIEGYERKETFIKSPEDLASDREYLNKFLTALKPDAKDIIVSLMEGNTLEQVGTQKGLTRERARQIKEETLQFFEGTKMYQDAND